MKKRTVSSLFSLIIIASIFVLPCTWAEEGDIEIEKNIQKGKRAYKRYCSACHGTSGKGDGTLASSIPPRDLTDKAYMSLLSDEDLFKRIKYGEESFPYLQMAGIGHKASKKTIWDIVYFIRTSEVNKGPLKGPTPKERAERFKDPMERGRVYYLRYCSPCHGTTEMAKDGASKR